MIYEDKLIQLFDEFSTNSYAGYTLILPAVSVGNIGQLAMDLILVNSKFTPVKIGRIFHPALEPVVATDIDQNNKAPIIMSPCELYQTDNKMLLLQFHSPVGKRLRNDFIDFLVNWIESQGINQVICLTSSFSSERNDSQLTGSQFRYLSYQIPDGICDILKSLDVLPLELRNFPAPSAVSQNSLLSNQQIMIHGGGIAQSLHDSLKSKNIPILHLIVFASEGVNIKEAEELYSIANSTLSLSDTKRIKHPTSWTNSLFYGDAPPPDIY